MAHVITIKNNCPFTIWPGIQGNPGHGHLENGGFSLGAYKTHTINTSRDWAGRIGAEQNAVVKENAKRAIAVSTYCQFVIGLL